MMAALPTEIIIEILSRLPVKSLLCCKTVCKFWNNLINTPNYIKLHLNQAIISNSDRYLIRWSDDYSLYSAKIDLDLDPNDLYFSKLNLPFETQKLLFVVGSCNGVVCITDSSKNDVLLYNPLTNSHRKLPANQIPNSKNYKSVIYGFGYDSKNDDYKVLNICEEFNLATTVYSLKSNTWKSVEGIQIQSPVFFDCIYGTLANESLHYMVYLINSDSTLFVRFIYSFDFRTESFSLMESPSDDIEGKFIRRNYTSSSVYTWVQYHVNCLLRELGGCLCLMLNYKNAIEVLVMKEYGNKESWTKLFCFEDIEVTIKREFLEPDVYYFKEKDGRRLYLVKLSVSEFAWYDLDTKKFTYLTSNEQPIYIFGTGCFVGSLVSLN